MRTLIVGLSFFVFAAIGAESLAQTTGGTVRGVIRDEQGAVLPGVVVNATSSSVAGAHSAVSDGEGAYRIINLPPGAYTIVAELQGFTTVARENIVVRAGLNLVVDFDMKVGALSETLTVVGDAPMLETSSAVQAVNVSSEMQESVPLAARRHYSEYLRFTPGAVARDSNVNQAAVFYVHGAGIVSHSTVIDGADMSSAVNPWHAYGDLPAGTIADVQIKTSGFDAATPLGLGTASNIVTKSGTNTLTGAASFALTPKAWVGDNTPGGTSETMSVLQPEIAAGGPVRRDSVWFFGSYKYRRGTFGIGRPADQVRAMEALEPSFEPFDREISANIAFVKVTGQVTPNHRAEAFYNRDATPYDSDGTFNIGKFQRTTIGGWGYSGRLASAWNSWLTSQFGFSWNNKGAVSSIRDPRLPSRPVYYDMFVSGGRLVGNTQFALLDNVASLTASPYEKWTVSGDMTAYRTGWIGSHEFRLGVFLQPRMLRRDTIQYAGGGLATESLVLLDRANPSGGTVAFHRRIYDADAGLLAAGRFSDNAFYVQDAWRPTSRLTLTIGLRADHVTRNDDLFALELQNSWEVGPRLGVNYVLTSDQQNAIRGSFMRHHDAANINAQSASGAGTQGSGALTIGYRDLYDMDLNGSFETVFATPAASPVSPNRIIDPDYHQPFVDEWAIGYRRQFPGQTSVDVGFMRRDYRHRTALVEQNGIYEGNVFSGYRDETQNEIYLLTSNVWNRPVYKSFDITATKNTSWLQILASYTRSWSHEAGTWQPNDPAFFIQPDSFPNSRGLYSNDNRSASRNNGYAAGTAGQEWMENVLRLSAVLQAPWGFAVATNYSLQKGLWSGPILDRLSGSDPRFGPPTVRLSNGRVVSNPLSTPVRFAFSTREEGQFVLPAAHYLNIRVGREFDLGGVRRLRIDFDVFNVPNKGAFQGFLAGANDRSNANFGRGGEVQPPRSAQLGLRFLF
jgi:hypothetical protein